MYFNADYWSSIIIFYGLKIVYAIAIFVVGRYLSRWIVSLSKRLMQKANIDQTLILFFSNVIYALLLVVVILMSLSKLGVNTTSFAAILAAAGLAAGLALQGTLSNIGAAALIIIFRPFQVGDFIEAGGASGIVEEINMFSTIMKTPDNKVIIIPNSSIIAGKIVNYSKKSTRRVDWVFGIGYDDDLKKAKQILEDIISRHTLILKEPAYLVAVSELADSSVNFTVRAWVNAKDYWSVYFDIIEQVKLSFDENSISIPYPQLDVHQK